MIWWQSYSAQICISPVGGDPWYYTLGYFKGNYFSVELLLFIADAESISHLFLHGSFINALCSNALL